MKKRNKNNQWLYSRFFIPNIIFIAIVSFLSLGIIYIGPFIILVIFLKIE